MINLKEVVDEFVDAHAKQTGTRAVVDRGKVLQTLQEIIAALRAKGITLTTILQFVGPILAMITAGTPASGIITAILGLLGTSAPPATGGAGT